MNPVTKMALSIAGAIAFITGATLIAANLKIGLFAESKSNSSVSANPNPTPSSSPIISSPSVSPVPQSGECSPPLNANMKVRFSAGMVEHLGDLRMRGCEGTMIVTYYSTQRERTEKVSQTMKLRSSDRGLMLYGYDPVYFGTTTPASYSADNFLFRQDTTGKLEFRNCDDANVCSPVAILAIDAL